MKLNHTKEEIRALADGATRGPLRLARYEEIDGNGVTAAEHVAENLSHGSGPVWGVMAPEHPLTVNGWDARPEHAVMTCITGNGPTSERNAAFYAAAPTIAADALAMHAEIARLRAENERIRARLARVVPVIEALDAWIVFGAKPTTREAALWLRMVDALAASLGLSDDDDYDTVRAALRALIADEVPRG